MRDLIEFITQGLLTKPARVVEETEGDVVRLTVYPAKEEIGLLIGKGGKTIKALRALLRVRATLEKKGVDLSIGEDTA